MNYGIIANTRSRATPVAPSLLIINSPLDGATVEDGDTLEYSINCDTVQIQSPLDGSYTTGDSITVDYSFCGTQPAPYDGEIPDTVFTQSINALQGAVTTSGFKVSAKVARYNRTFTLKVYTDAARTVEVFTSTPKTSDLLKLVRFEATGLSANTKYYWAIISDGTKTNVMGELKTLPSGNASFKLVAGSCAHGQKGGADDGLSNHPIFAHIMNERADEIALMWHTGDMHYRDKNTSDISIIADNYDGVLRKPNQQNLYLKVPLMYMWDDHDFLGNDSQGKINLYSTKEALKVYRGKFPHYPTPLTGELDSVCHTVKIGRVQLINLDTRSQKDTANGTILGAAQKQWLKDTMLNSTAEAFIVNVGCVWIADSIETGDNWFAVEAERTELMDFFINNGFDDKMFLLAGDAHCLALDDGTNNRGIKVAQFAAYDSPASIKGGPYSVTPVATLHNYGMFDIEDKGTTIDISAIGYHFNDVIAVEQMILKLTITI